MTTSSKNLTTAHKSVLAISEAASRVLADHEGYGTIFTYGSLAEAIGIDLRSLGQTDKFLAFMALDAAIEFRGWQDIQADGEVKRFQKAASIIEFKKLTESAVARERRRKA